MFGPIVFEAIPNGQERSRFRIRMAIRDEVMQQYLT